MTAQFPRPGNQSTNFTVSHDGKKRLNFSNLSPLTEFVPRHFRCQRLALIMVGQIAIFFLLRAAVAAKCCEKIKRGSFTIGVKPMFRAERNPTSFRKRLYQISAKSDRRRRASPAICKTSWYFLHRRATQSTVIFSSAKPDISISADLPNHCG